MNPGNVNMPVQSENNYSMNGDYSDVLMKNSFIYSEHKNYYLVGEVPKTYGWVIYLSIIRSDIHMVLSLVLPVLKSQEISFAIVKDRNIAKYILDGNLGYSNLAKILQIYPGCSKQALELAKILISLTSNFRGPVIPTAAHLGHLVYTAYEDPNEFTLDTAFNNPNKKSSGSFDSVLRKNHDNTKKSGKTDWPFREITEPVYNFLPKLLNKRYKPLFILKADAKGQVLKGIYMKGLFNVKSCILKEGKKDMWTDEQGRDMEDRLKWQYQLSMDLHSHIPLPKIIDHFRENNASYLVMEFVKGQPLEDVILERHDMSTWSDMPNETKIALLNLYLSITNVIQILHKKGYVHRDITPNNFLVQKKGQIYLIDMELAYCIRESTGLPPFKLGTVGYMSEEQSLQKEPTYAEDSYALGALLAFLCTGLPPVKFDIRTKYLSSNLFYLINDIQICEIISRCLTDDANERPNVLEITQSVSRLAKSLKNKSELNEREIESQVSSELNNYPSIEETIQCSVDGLVHPFLITDSNIWFTLLSSDPLIGNNQMETALLTGCKQGISGIIYLLSIAKMNGFDVSKCLVSYQNSWAHVQKVITDAPEGEHLGLFEGMAGIAVAIAYGVRAELLPADPIILNLLTRCFENNSNLISIDSGLAGQGIALIQCQGSLPNEFIDRKLFEYINIILGKQLTNGAWNIPSNIRSQGTDLGFASGIPGVLYFLLIAVNRFPNDNRIKDAVIKGMKWLTRNAKRKGNAYLWTTSINSKNLDLVSFEKGVPGIIFLYIKAFQVLNDPNYKSIAISSLDILPGRIIHVNFSVLDGLSGLGHLYLEASKVFKNTEWIARADWIVELFKRTCIHHRSGSGYWAMDAHPEAVSNLMYGACGIIHFLIRRLNIEKINYPLLPL